MTTPEDFIPTETTSAPPFIPIPDNIQASIATAPFDDSLTKGQYHRKKQKKKLRAKLRRSGLDPEMNRPVKGVALKEPANSLLGECGSNHPKMARPGTSSADCSVSDSRPRGPIASDLHLDMDELPVASTAYTGVLKDPSAEDLACVELEDFAAREFQYIEWDGL